MVFEGAKAWIKREAQEWAEAADPRNRGWDDTVDHVREVAKDWQDAAKTGGRDLRSFFGRKPLVTTGLIEELARRADAGDLEGTTIVATALAEHKKPGFTQDLGKKAPNLRRAFRIFKG